MKRLLFVTVLILFQQAGFTQNIGIGVANPDEQIHVDSAVRIGRNQVLSPLRKNLLKFGDGNYITIGEEKTDDKLYIRFGRLALMPNSNRSNDGFVGVNVDTATAQLDIDGTLRFRGIGEAAGHVLTSDALGNATWRPFSTTGWSLTGNAGTNPATNFLGTTDNQPLMFRQNNIYAGRWDYAQRNYFIGNQSGKNTTGRNNIAIGDSALLKNITGYSNVAVGSGALQNNTDKGGLVAIGDSALFKNGTYIYDQTESGKRNTAVGSKALYNNSAGHGNTAIGFEAGYNMGLGRNNVAIGFRAMSVGNSSENEGSIAIGSYALDSTIDQQNTAIGTYSMRRNKLGFNNTAVGHSSLYDNSSGEHNVAFGHQTMRSNVSGHRNTGIGWTAMMNNVTGSDNTALGPRTMSGNISGNNNTALGQGALGGNGNSNVAVGTAALGQSNNRSNLVAVGDSALLKNSQGATEASQGIGNAGIGSKVLWSNTLGSFNTGAGSNAMANKVSGLRNTAIGYASGQNSLTGNYCTFLGAYTDVDNGNTTYSNSTAIGDGVRITASNQVRVGDNSVTSIGGQVGWTTLSDGRFKRDIAANVPGLLFINQLQPLTYRLRTTELQQKTETEGKDNSQAAAMVLSGFVAQDVEAAAKRIGYSFSGVDGPRSANGYYGLRYADFVVPLVKAAQELSQMNEQLQQKLSEQQLLIQTLERRLTALEKLIK